MSISLIPETAPFSSEQRAWLNGFLAGWTGINGAAESDNGLAATAVESVLALPSANGHSEARPPEQDEEFPWHDESLSMDERLRLADGKPLKRRLMAAMAQLDCGACGYVCKTYSEAIAAGEEKNLTLCSPGGKQTTKMLKKLLKEEKSTSNRSAPAASTNGHSAASNGATSNGMVTKPVGYSRLNPFPAKVKEVRNLNGPGSAKHTCHVVIDLSGSNLRYRVGDALGVFPTNCPELVDEILARVRLDRTNGELAKLRADLISKYCLRNVEEELVELLLFNATVEEERVALSKLLEMDTMDDLDSMDVLDVLALAPSVQLDASSLVERLGPLNPRLYSIASSLSAHPDEVHLTVGRVTTERGGRLRKGVASTMFADRMQPGDEVRVFVHAASDFTVPADPQVPIIMVGPGTGIAPFRAFLEERRSAGARGKNWLFFGDQHAATDFLYRSELKQMHERGVLTRIDTAFSRDQDQKAYVQHRMLEHGQELFSWLEQGAYFFVCGDARRMAVDVDNALHEVAATHGQMSPEQASDYVKRLKDSKRYVRDVY